MTDPVETAWRIHTAVTDWTGKVDNKAAFALTIESAALAGVVTLTGDGHGLHNLHGFVCLGLFWLGISVLILGVISAILVVMPNVRRSKIGGEWRQNFVFFGHLRCWPPDELADAIKDEDIMPMLARQLTNMSVIAWKKHQRVQLSMGFALVGMGLIGICYIVA